MRLGTRVGVTVRLLLHGIAYRRGVAALTVVVSVIAIASATVVPVYRSAASASALRARMTTATADQSGVEVAGTSWPGNSPDVTLQRLTPRLPLASAVIPGITMGGPVSQRNTSTQLAAAGGVPEAAALEWRQDDCHHVVFRSGHCPTARNELALSTNAARVLHATLGGEVVAAYLDNPTFGGVTDLFGNTITRPPPLTGLAVERFALHERLAGVFDVPPSQLSYWLGKNIAAPVLNVNASQTTIVTALVPRQTLTSLPPPFRTQVTVDQPLDWSHASVSDVTRVNDALATFQRRLPKTVSTYTDIPALLKQYDTDRAGLGRLMTLAESQLLLLVALVLIAVVAAGMGRRRSEFVVSALAGRRPLSTAVRVAVEPVLLVLVGVIPGLLLAIPAARLASHLWLRSDTPVRLTRVAVTSGVAMTLGVVLVTVVVGLLAAARPAAEQLAEDARSAGGRSGAWLDLVVATLAIAGLTELLTNRSTDSSTPWALLAPSLCGLAVALLLGRLIPLLLRSVVRLTDASTRLARFFTIRELRRDRASWRITAMVALALSLLAFAVTVSRGATADRHDRAGLVVGAPTVVSVTSPSGTSLLSDVQKVDPTGSWAMAAKLIVPFGSDALRTLAVDTPRLAAVAGWSRPIDGYDAKGLARLLSVPPDTARRALPVISAGSDIGSTIGLNNQSLPGIDPHAARLLPVLLDAGSLVDLRSLIAAAPAVPPALLGTTTITDQVWLGKRAPANAIDRLSAAGFRIDGVQHQSATISTLRSLAEPAGLDGYLAIGVLAAALAIALLIGTSAANSTREQVETLALVSAGVSRRTVILSRGFASAARLLLAAGVGLACGLGTAHLAGHLIPQALPGTIPAPLLPLPTWPAVLAVIATLLPALIAEAVIIVASGRSPSMSALRAALA